MTTLSDQSAHQLATGDDAVGAAERIVKFLAMIDAQQMIDRGEQIGWGGGTIGGKGTNFVAGPVHETRTNAPSGQHHGVTEVPVVAPGVGLSEGNAPPPFSPRSCPVNETYTATACELLTE